MDQRLHSLILAYQRAVRWSVSALERGGVPRPSAQELMSTSSMMQPISIGYFKGGLAVIACLAMPLSACTHVLADRDWNPHVRPSDCEVRIVYSDGSRNVDTLWHRYYDARGRFVSGTAGSPEGVSSWENHQYDAHGRLIATTSQKEEPGRRDSCLGEGEGDVDCGNPAMRTIDRVDLEWDSSGRLSRKHHTYDEYHADNLKEKEYVRWRYTDEVIEYDYDNAGRLLTVSSGGSRGTLEYDSHGRPVRVISEHPGQPTRRYAITYDADGRIASRESWLGTNLFHYDSQGRMARREVDSNYEFIERDTWEYGADGAVTRQVTDHVDAANNVRPESREEYLYFYDEAGRLHEVRYPQGLMTYAYSGKCNEVRLGPRSLSPMEEGGCAFSPYGVRQTCR